MRGQERLQNTPDIGRSLTEAVDGGDPHLSFHVETAYVTLRRAQRASRTMGMCLHTHVPMGGPPLDHL